MMNLKRLFSRRSSKPANSTEEMNRKTSEIEKPKIPEKCNYKCSECQGVGCCFSCAFCEGVRFYYDGAYFWIQFNNNPRDLVIVTCRFESSSVRIVSQYPTEWLSHDLSIHNEIHDRIFRIPGPAFLNDLPCPNWQIRTAITDPNLSKTENGNFQSFWR